jgi:hypothetical protein
MPLRIYKLIRGSKLCYVVKSYMNYFLFKKKIRHLAAALEAESGAGTAGTGIQPPPVAPMHFFATRPQACPHLNELFQPKLTIFCGHLQLTSDLFFPFVTTF